MLNFPVASGTSGHLLGGALAAILVGPCTGLLCMATVLPRAVPALRRRRHHRARHQHRPDGRGHRRGRLDGLQDAPGGAPQAALDGGAVGRRSRRWSPCRSRRSASCSSTPSAAPPTSRSTTWLTAMVGVHVLIGIGEAAITGLAVGSIVAVRPDLVYGARPVLEKRELVVRTDVREGRRMKPTRTSVLSPLAASLLAAWSLAGRACSSYAERPSDGLDARSSRRSTGFADSDRRADQDRRGPARRLRQDVDDSVLRRLRQPDRRPRRAVVMGWPAASRTPSAGVTRPRSTTRAG